MWGYVRSRPYPLIAASIAGLSMDEIGSLQSKYDTECILKHDGKGE
jgi:hypothetical protein